MLHSTPFVQRKKSGFFGDAKSYSPILKKPQKKPSRISPLIDEPVSPIACNPAVDPVSPVLSDKDFGILRKSFSQIRTVNLQKKHFYENNCST